ncbi:MAG: exodeoxyribonuclease III [Mogibacterium sp.]|nr:exodeoxyribonuclease III [Mogibacterium sp.]
MKFASWNVNGFRAVLNKGFEDAFAAIDTDFFCLQETKMQEGQADFHPEDYYEFYNYAEKKGYSGTAVFARKTLGEPLSVAYGIHGEHDDEGRVITLEYPEFYLITCYVPNAKDGLARIGYRCEFEDAMRAYLQELDQVKPVVYCGDLNVAHNEIDLKNPKTNRGNAGFSDEERGKMTELLGAGFTDTFRYLYPEQVTYSWWSYRFRAREKNAGWRIDYFIISDRLRDKLKEAEILTDVMGSDHCPVTAVISFDE